MTLQRTKNLPHAQQAWTGAKKIQGDKIASIDGEDGWDVAVYRAGRHEPASQITQPVAPSAAL